MDMRMRLVDYLDTGASLGADQPCLTMAGRDYSYAEVQTLSYRIARSLVTSGIAAGDKVAILSGNDPIAFSCVSAFRGRGCLVPHQSAQRGEREPLYPRQFRLPLSDLSQRLCRDGREDAAGSAKAG